MSVEAALTKLMRLFGDGLSSAQVREAFPTDLAGEWSVCRIKCCQPELLKSLIEGV